MSALVHHVTPSIKADVIDLFRMLKEKISLLSPTSSPHKKRMSTSPKLHHRVRPLVGMKAAASASNGVKHSSPLLRKAASPLVTGGKMAVTEYEEGWSKTRDVV